MAKFKPKYNLSFLSITGAICLLGLLILFSAALGSAAEVGNTMLVQLVGMFLGAIAIYFALYVPKIDYRLLYKKHYVLYALVGAVFLQLMVFSPFGLTRNGATRWIDIGVTTIQPSEILKIVVVLFLALLLVAYRKRLGNIRTSTGVVASTAGVFALLMLIIRDKGSIIIMGITVIAMLLASSMRRSHIFLLVVAGVFSLISYVVLFSSEQYAKDRLSSFAGAIHNPLGQDYQTNQAIITIGSGEAFGKGLGQSLQKHRYLPEPVTDSIFAIYVEEWGFGGAVVLLFLYLLFLWFGLAIARESKTEYGRYIVIGLVVMIVAQSLFNIMSLIRLVPLSGVPLVFISKGGTSLVTSLVMVAIVLNVSRVSQTTSRTKGSWR